MRLPTGEDALLTAADETEISPLLKSANVTYVTMIYLGMDITKATGKITAFNPDKTWEELDDWVILAKVTECASRAVRHKDCCRGSHGPCA
jgi:hypothetical protein